MGTILYPPLKKFILAINFPDIENPTIDILSEINNKLSDRYPAPTKIKLISSKGPESELFFGPIRFLSKKQDNEILIFKDAFVFEYNDKYTSWHEVFPILIENFAYLAEKLNIKLVNRISLDYIDLFNKFPQKKFDLKYYFTIDLNIPHEFDLDYKDFIIGIKLETNNTNQNSILRIRGLKPDNEDFFKIQLETHYTILEDIKIDNKEFFIDNCNIAHNALLNNFKIVLTDNTKKIIGI